MYEYRVVAVMGVDELLRRGNRGRGRAEDIAQGELPDEVVGMALEQFSKEGWRLHTIMPLNTDLRRASNGYLVVFEKERASKP